MSNRFERLMALTGVAAVAFWIAGLVVANGLSDSISDKATDRQILAWVQHNTTTLIVGAWLFAIGCLCFVWFGGVLRTRLASTEDTSTVSTITFAGLVATAIFGMLIPLGDFAVAINKNDVSAATAGTLHHVGDMFFAGAELSAVVLMTGVAVLGFRNAAVPRWWAAFSVLVAIVLLIGPIGWAALIFGVPVWTLVTAGLLLRTPRTRRAAVPAPAGA